MSAGVTVSRGEYRLLRASAFVLALVICVGAALILRVPWWEGPIDRDPMAYATLGQHLGWDSLPYRDLFDHKQPLVYPFFAVLDSLWPAQVGALRATSAVMAGLTAYLVLLAVARLEGAGRAVAAAAIALVAGSTTYVEGGDLNVEHLVVPFTAAAVLVPLVLRDRPWRWLPVAAGLLAALALLMKIAVLPGALAGLVALLLRREARGQGVVRTLALYAAGVAAPVLVVALFYAARGGLSELFEANVTFNREYGKDVTLAKRWDELREDGVMWWLVAGAALAGAARLAVRGPRRDVVGLTLVAWLAGAVVGAIAPGHGFAHYYVPVIPAAACLLAVVPLPRRLPRAAAIGVAVLLVAAVVFPFTRDAARNFGRGPHEIAFLLYDNQVRIWGLYEPLSAPIRERAQPQDRLYVAGSEPGFYWYSRVRPASRIIYESTFEALPKLRREVERGMCRYPPRFVILVSGFWPPHLNCLERRVEWTEVARLYSAVVLDRGPGPLELPPER